MHEMSIALEIVRAVQDQIEQEQEVPLRVRQIYVKIGRFANVLSDPLRFSFELATAGTVLENAELVIEESPLVIGCDKCDAESQLEEPHFVCPKCESTDVTIITGQELTLESIVVQEQP